MLYLILITAGAASSVAPVVLGNEILFRIRHNFLRLSAGKGGKRFPSTRTPPGIFYSNTCSRVIDGVAHGKRGIGFTVENARDDRDGLARNQLAYENHTATPAVVGSATDIEP